MHKVIEFDELKFPNCDSLSAIHWLLQSPNCSEKKMPLSRRTFIAASSIATGLAMKSVAKDQSKKGHVVLLGDSILDNKPYVGNDPCVVEQVQSELVNHHDFGSKHSVVYQASTV